MEGVTINSFHLFLKKKFMLWVLKRTGLKVIKLDNSLRLKVKRNDWLLADMCP